MLQSTVHENRDERNPNPCETAATATAPLSPTFPAILTDGFDTLERREGATDTELADLNRLAERMTDGCWWWVRDGEGATNDR